MDDMIFSSFILATQRRFAKYKLNVRSTLGVVCIQRLYMGSILTIPIQRLYTYLAAVLGEMSLLLLFGLESLRKCEEVVLFQLESLDSPLVVDTEWYEVVPLPLGPASPESAAEDRVLVLEVPVELLGDVSMGTVDLQLDGVQRNTGHQPHLVLSLILRLRRSLSVSGTSIDCFGFSICYGKNPPPIVGSSSKP